MPRVSRITKGAQEYGQGSYQKPFGTKHLVICKLANDCSRSRELEKLSKLYLLAAVSSVSSILVRKTGRNPSIAIECLGLCKCSSSFQDLYLLFLFETRIFGLCLHLGSHLVDSRFKKQTLIPTKKLINDVAMVTHVFGKYFLAL